jgi:HSP20 family protein
VTRKPVRLTDLALLHREVNQLFERLTEVERADRAPTGAWVPPVDVYESRGRLNVVVEVPGLVPESLRVALRDRQLVITGERHAPHPHGPVAFLCMERPHGRFTREIPLDVAVDVREAQARLSKGLLTIELPRVKDRRGHETVIPIHREPTP